MSGTCLAVHSGSPGNQFYVGGGYSSPFDGVGCTGTENGYGDTGAYFTNAEFVALGGPSVTCGANTSVVGTECVGTAPAGSMPDLSEAEVVSLFVATCVLFAVAGVIRIAKHTLFS